MEGRRVRRKAERTAEPFEAGRMAGSGRRSRGSCSRSRSLEGCGGTLPLWVV